MTPFNVLVVLKFGELRYNLSLTDYVKIKDRDTGSFRVFQPGIASIRVPSRRIDMTQIGGGKSSGSGSIAVSSEFIDLWSLSKTTVSPQHSTITAYAFTDNEYIDECTLLYTGVLGPARFNFTDGTWAATMIPAVYEHDVSFPPINVGEGERYGIKTWPCFSAIALDDFRGESDYPGGIYSVSTEEKQNANSSLPVVYGTVYDASVPVIQGRLLTWIWQGDNTIYSAVVFDVGLACHTIIGTRLYNEPGSSVNIVGGTNFQGAITGIRGYVNMNQGNYILPNDFTYGMPADMDQRSVNRRCPHPFYYVWDKKEDMNAVATVRPPNIDEVLPIPSWIDIDAIAELVNPNSPLPQDNVGPIEITMPEVDTGTWNIPELTGKPKPGSKTEPISRLGDVLLDLWKTFAKNSMKSIDIQRIENSMAEINRYEIGLFINSKPKLVTLTRMLSSRIGGQFPVSFGAPYGLWGFESTRFPDKSDPIVRSLSYPGELISRMAVEETSKKDIRNRFLVKYRYSGFKGETTKLLSTDKTNNKECKISVGLWGESPLHTVDCPDITDDTSAAHLTHEWVKRLSRVRIRYIYETFDTSILSLRPSAHLTLSDPELGLYKESVCYEGCDIDTGAGRITVYFVSIEDLPQGQRRKGNRARQMGGGEAPNVQQGFYNPG